MDRVPHYQHAISIHAAWERVELVGDSIAASSAKVTLPDAKPVATSTECLAYSRKFNLPSGLEGTQRVELECSLLGVASNATLNEKPMSLSHGKTRFDITAMLRLHNSLRIVIPVHAIVDADLSIARLLIVES